MAEAVAGWANPSSPHAEGRAARRALEGARARIGASLGWTGELIFTSGASEALAIALGRGLAPRRMPGRIVSAVEHDAVFRAAPDAAPLPVRDGAVDRDALADALAAGPAIVAVQHVNPETGTIQPVAALAAQVRAAGGAIVSDCAQSAGRLALPDADMIVVSAHKLGGPPGIGALLVRDLSLLAPVGGHEFGYRQGTENLPAILGFAAAAERIALDGDGVAGWLGRAGGVAAAMRELEAAAERPGGASIGASIGAGPRAPHIVALAMPHLPAAAQLIRFDAMGFAVSAGSACSSGTLKRSRALAAFGVAEALAARTIRVSIGWSTTAAELRAFAEAWCAMADAAARRAA